MAGQSDGDADVEVLVIGAGVVGIYALYSALDAGFSAQTCAGATIYVATHLGYPLSTTHVISGAVLGSGSTSRL